MVVDGVVERQCYAAVLRPLVARPPEMWKRIREIVLVMPDGALPRDALLSYDAMIKNGVELSARQPNRVTLLDDPLR